MRPPRVCYSASQYQSHRRVARDYREIIKAAYPLALTPNSADIVVLHHEPPGFAALYRAYPPLARKYVIAYCVWEASALPDAYRRAVECVQEIWTCSRYCCSVLRQYHPNVFHIPHVVERDTACSDEDRLAVRKAIGYEEGVIYYLAITSLRDKRKNTHALMPRLHPGSGLVIDLSIRGIRKGAWPRELDRPLYLCEIRGGYTCSWCEEEDGHILVVPRPQSPCRVRRFAHPQDIGVAGQVVAVVTRLAALPQLAAAMPSAR